MIQNNVQNQLFFSFKGVSPLSSLVVPGSIVRVEILGKAAGGGTLVRIAGETFTASGVARFAQGETVNVRVSFSGNTVFLHPVGSPQSTVPPDVFARLGVNQGGTAAFLVSFFQKINARLDGNAINALSKLSSRFPLKEGRAAEAAAILSERGIEPSYEAVSRLVSAMEGKTGDGEGGSEGNAERYFLSFINHKKGQELHWIIIPFNRVFADQQCSGSIRFLLDTAAGVHRETRITFLEGDRCWEFEVEGNICRFTAEPSFKSVNFDKFVVYLKSLLSAAGIADVSWHAGEDRGASLIQSVDLEI